MFRVRRIIDDVLPMDRAAIEQVRAILRARFPGVRKSEWKELPDRLRNPFAHRFQTRLFVADDMRGEVQGFALVSHEPDLRFLFLDYIAAGERLSGRGIGGALYERVRYEARSLGVVGLFFECAPDIQEDCESEEEYRANVARLRFYERYGARPLVENDYRRPVREGDRGMPYLVFDPVDGPPPLRRARAREIVRAILERKYAHLCPPEYVDAVVASFRSDPVPQREPRYGKERTHLSDQKSRPEDASVLLVVNDRHQIHHVRDRGYVEAPVRIPTIRAELEASGLFREVPPKAHAERHILDVHDRELVRYLERCCQSLPEGKSVYPYVFPIRNAARPPKELAVRAGYFCIDTFTPINRNAFLAARRAVDCGLTAAASVEAGQRLAYALVRPPGHHAERRAFGGFCYFNSSAVAANYLARGGSRVAVLDVDYHHGNGTQDIFYRRSDVLTISIHGHPRFAYPYFSGFAEEAGEEAGEGFNLNLPLPEQVDGARYRQALAKAVARIRAFSPTYLVVALGLDPGKGDPTGTWSLSAADFEENGRMIGVLRLPTLVVQEGGYRTRTLGVNARRFFVGLVGASLGGAKDGKLRHVGRHGSS